MIKKGKIGTVKPVQAAEPPRRRGPKVDVELNRRRKSDILREAARLFDRVGYHQVNMEQIAEATGLRKPTLYHYIRSKDQILFEIQEIIMRTLQSGMDARRAEHMGPAESLHGMFRDVFNIMEDYPGFVRVFFESMREIQDERREEVGNNRRQFVASVTEVVSEGMAQGLFRNADPRLTALFLFGVCNWSYQWYRPGGKQTPQELADQCWDFASGGLLTPKAAEAKI